MYQVNWSKSRGPMGPIQTMNMLQLVHLKIALQHTSYIHFYLCLLFHIMILGVIFNILPLVLRFVSLIEECTIDIILSTQQTSSSQQRRISLEKELTLLVWGREIYFYKKRLDMVQIYIR